MLDLTEEIWLVLEEIIDDSEEGRAIVMKRPSGVRLYLFKVSSTRSTAPNTAATRQTRTASTKDSFILKEEVVYAD